MVAVQARPGAVPIELELELHLVTTHGLATDRASVSVSRPTEGTVSTARRQVPAPDGFVSFRGEVGLVRHGRSPSVAVAVLGRETTPESTPDANREMNSDSGISPEFLGARFRN